MTLPGLHAFAWEPTPEKKMPFNPFSVLTSKIFAGLSLALLLAFGIQTARVSHYRSTAAKWHEAYDTQKAAYSAASAAAVAEQKALYASISARSRDKARFADESNRMAQDRARSAVAGYADRMRLDRICPGARIDPATPAAPADRDRPGNAAEYVAVTRNDFELMVANSVRLDEVRKWGESLVNDGLAVPAPAFGQPESEKR